MAAHISRAGVCAELLETVLVGHEPFRRISSSTNCELGQTQIPGDEIEGAVAHLTRAARIVQPSQVPAEACRDRQDLPVLGTAVAGRCAVLVTVDKDLLSIGTYEGVGIIMSGEFWRRVRQ
jgi:predicted nucleic acid-binding protein